MPSLTYDTTDLGIAAALYVSGIPLSGIKHEPATERFRKGRAVFQFEDELQAKVKVQEYYRGVLNLDAKALLTTYLEYRRLAYNKEQIGG